MKFIAYFILILFGDFFVKLCLLNNFRGQS